MLNFIPWLPSPSASFSELGSSDAGSRRLGSRPKLTCEGCSVLAESQGQRRVDLLFVSEYLTGWDSLFYTGWVNMSFLSCFRPGFSPRVFPYAVRLKPPLRKRSVKSTKCIQEGLQVIWLSWRIWRMIRLSLKTLSWVEQLSKIKSTDSHESWHSLA